MRVLGVGIATLDIINTVASYPLEDEEIRVVSQRRVRGGNATNTLVILSQQGHACAWAGVLPLEPDAELVLADLGHYRIQSDFCTRPHQGKLPTSYISLSQATGSRTIAHYRDMPEYCFRAFDRIDLSQFDWIHFEGRGVSELAPMLEKVTARPGLRCSLEVEKPRQGIEALLPLADLVLFSRHYVISRGYEQAGSFLRRSVARSKSHTWPGVSWVHGPWTRLGTYTIVRRFHPGRYATPLALAMCSMLVSFTRACMAAQYRKRLPTLVGWPGTSVASKGFREWSSDAENPVPGG